MPFTQNKIMKTKNNDTNRGRLKTELMVPFRYANSHYRSFVV